MPRVLQDFDAKTSLRKRAMVRLGLVAKPSLLIIGTQKAATSTLFQVFTQHPNIVAPARKELSYFNDGTIPYGQETMYRQYLPTKLKTWNRKITFEATPDYLMNPQCPVRIRAFRRDIKLIAILREPISRVFSAWNMYSQMSLHVSGT